MSEATVQGSLLRRFEAYRVVFWQDPEGEYDAEVDNLDLGDVQIVRVADNEFAIKNRLLEVEPETKFLIYRAGPSPSGIGNWLLDLELAFGVFTADRTALLMQDLGLTSQGISEVLAANEKFLNSGKRVQNLKTLLNPDDDSRTLQAKMCAVLLSQREHTLMEITRALLVENAKGVATKYRQLVELGLDGFFWRGVESIYGYESSAPSIDDFVLWLFRQAVAGFKSDRPGGLRNIQLDFAGFRNDRRSQDALATLAKRAALNLNYADSIETVSFRDLLDNDTFEEVDQKVISDLAREIADQTLSAREVAVAIQARQTSVWIDSYRQLYDALAAGSELLNALATFEASIESFDHGLVRYRDVWFRIDQLYRQFTVAVRTYEGNHPLGPLRDQVEKRYTNQFVYELGGAWQQQVDQIDAWRSLALRSQMSFYSDHIEGLIRDGDKKAVVIISDALRYEVADELCSRIRQEDRFEADLGAVLGVLPSYTQLGMAALLPHRTLKHSDDAKAVLADDRPTNGTAFRAKILEAVDGSAIRAEDFKALDPEARRELYKANRVLYVYHDRIDATGDKPGTEQMVFEAVDDTLREIVDLVKKLTSANATNIFITADHGFLFQDDELADQFYLSVKPHGDDVKVTNRRYVLGTGMKHDPAFATFSARQLGLDSNLEVQIPKSVHRLRIAGGGSRFVHGGATLQEVVVPVLAVKKKRRSDTRQVNVEILPESDKITTGQLVVKLFQAEPANEKIRPRILRAGIWAGDTLISNAPELVFDRTSDDKRDRYQNAQMLLSQDADAFNSKFVELRLEELIANTTHWRLYAKATYMIRRSFTTDFDF